MKALVLFSGGLDSTTCLAMAVDKYGAENVTALSLQYGQKHNKEIESAEKIVKYYGVQHITYDVSKIFEMSNCSLLTHSDAEVPEESYADQIKKTGGNPVSTYVPFRNGLLLSIAASVALSIGCKEIYCGIHADDAAGNAYPDCSVLFYDRMNRAIFEGSGKQVLVIAPFVEKNKAEVVKEGLRLGVPYELTWSCYEGGDKPCGKCGTCLDRIKAFAENGVKDPLELL